MRRFEENLKELEKWLSEQTLNGHVLPEQQLFIEGILNALPDETSTLSYFNHSNEVSEPLLDAVLKFIKRQIETFGRPPDPAQLISQTVDDYSSLAPSKSERIHAWISRMKAEGRLAPVQEPRLRAILIDISEEAELSRALRGFVECTPSLFTPLLEGEDVSVEREVEDSDENLDSKIQLFQASKNDLSEFMESAISKDFEERIRQAEQENDIERAWVLDRCLGSFQGILEFKSVEDTTDNLRVLEPLLIWTSFSTNVIQMLRASKPPREFWRSKLNVRYIGVDGILSRMN
jgi:hypothetical protein